MSTISKLKHGLIFSCAVTLILLVAAALRVSGAENGFATLLNNKWFQLAAALSVQFFAGSRFYKKLYGAFLPEGASVDILVALASASAFILSVYNSFFHSGGGIICFESPSVLVTLALLGEYLEQTVAGNIPDFVKKLSAAGTDTARVRRAGEELEVPAEQVLPGDTVIVRLGDIVPADGEILSGLAGVNESALTGQIEQVDKQPGDKVYAASSCVYGEFTMIAEKTGSDTVLARVIHALSEHHGSRESVCKTFKKILGFYVPSAIFAAISVFVWQWLRSGELFPVFSVAVSVLMAACPCALGLAAPTVLRIMTGKAAENGIIFNGGGYLNTHRPDVILLGKTGVVTEGRPEITDIIAFPGFFEEEIVSFAASAAKNSAHPIDRAIYGYTQPKVIFSGLSETVVRSGSDELVTLRSETHGFIGSVPEAVEFEPLSGYGVRAVVGGREILLGSRGILRVNGVDISAYEKLLARLEEDGKTVTLVAIRRKAAGVIATADRIFENARQSVDMLKSLGSEIYMLTGDSARTAKSVGRQAGIDNVIADILPADKSAGIARLKEMGKTVAVIGCGKSDAPALAAADFGITSNFDDNSSTADITLLRGGLNLACEAVSLSNSAALVIRRILILSLACNAAGITIAAVGAFPPAVMAAVMAFTCIFSSMLPSRFDRFMPNKGKVFT